MEKADPQTLDLAQQRRSSPGKPACSRTPTLSPGRAAQPSGTHVLFSSRLPGHARLPPNGYGTQGWRVGAAEPRHCLQMLPLLSLTNLLNNKVHTEKMQRYKISKDNFLYQKKTCCYFFLKKTLEYFNHSGNFLQ